MVLVVIFAPEVAPFCIHPPLTLLKALAHCALMKIVWQERQGMLSRSYWRPRKKNYWSLRFEPWTKLGSKSALLRKPYFLDHSQIPTRECVFFLPRQTKCQSRPHCIADSSDLPHTRPSPLAQTIFSHQGGVRN